MEDLNPSINASRSATTEMVYGSFFLGETEVALGIEHVQEVVNYPERISIMPLAPEFLDGDI